MPGASHIAYADEAYTTASRYRSLAAVTLPAEIDNDACSCCRDLVDGSGMSEFKWIKLRDARGRFAALKLVDFVFELALQGSMRVDVLIWDTHDTRHRISGRDDIANLERMYYHLFKNILLRRWPSGSSWRLYPDENSALDWAAFEGYLDLAAFAPSAQLELLDGPILPINVAPQYDLVGLEEVESHRAPLCQVADLFAGLSVYSREAYDKFASWASQSSGQLRLPLDTKPSPKLTRRDRERCLVLDHLDQKCKTHRMMVALKSSRGLRSHNPAKPINFWPYAPKSPADKAPTRPNSPPPSP
jgi:hypothetical protein